MMLQFTFKKLSSYQLIRLACLMFSLISISDIKISQIGTITKQAEALLLPKARICFNSMTPTFQSGCVFCDFRLYTSTISSCTGQSTLASNITQTEAFCIMTACLQQTGKNPTLFGRSRMVRSLQLIPVSLNGDRQEPNSVDGATAAQLTKSTYGAKLGSAASSNLSSAYILSNPLGRIFNWSPSNKTLQWQLHRGRLASSTVLGSSLSASSTGSGASKAGQVTYSKASPTRGGSRSPANATLTNAPRSIHLRSSIIGS